MTNTAEETQGPEARGVEIRHLGLEAGEKRKRGSLSLVGERVLEKAAFVA